MQLLPTAVECIDRRYTLNRDTVHNCYYQSVNARPLKLAVHMDLRCVVGLYLAMYKSYCAKYKSLCVWSSHYIKDKFQIEHMQVQRRFTKMIPELRNFSYETRLKKLNLWTLEERIGTVQTLWKSSKCSVEFLQYGSLI